MNTEEMIRYIAESEKKTPVKVYVRLKEKIDWKNARVFGNLDCIVFGDWKDIEPVLQENQDVIMDYIVEENGRNTGIGLLDIKPLHARIEPGAIIRENVEIGEHAIIMMGAIINIGAVIGDGSMIDMGAVIGGRAIVGKNCHIGAGAVLAGVIEPASATPVIIEDNVLIGANAVVIEGVHVGKNAVIGAGAVVIEDVAENTVVAGCPARFIKWKDERTSDKTALQDGLRSL